MAKISNKNFANFFTKKTQMPETKTSDLVIKHRHHECVI